MYPNHSFENQTRLTRARRSPPVSPPTPHPQKPANAQQATCTVALMCAILVATRTGAEERPPIPQPSQIRFFEQRIRPILVRHCYECHSARAKPLKGKLRLDFRNGIRTGGESGPAIIPGKPSESLLLSALRYQELQMPPTGKLSDRIIADFAMWIQSGAVDPRQLPDATRAGGIDFAAARQFWSFRPLHRTEVPPGFDRWSRNAIDRFIAAAQRQAGIEPGDEAAPTTLLRRAYFGLTGLPPSQVETTAFRDGYSDEAYEHLIDRLLDSPRFGERWARYWLDIARFGESGGFEMDYDRPHAWRYRDFVIRALNDDMPYDQFVRLQIAGDHLHPDDPTAAIATGFVVAGVENLIQSRKDFVQHRYDKIDDMVSTVGTGLLGLTIGCARCHDHKYDPISQREYYRVSAAFASTVSSLTEFRAGDETLKSYTAAEVEDGRIHMIVVTEPTFTNLPSIPARVHFLVRGDPQNQREAMTTGFPRVLVGGAQAPSQLGNQPANRPSDPGRVKLARWLTDTDTGAGRLLARVIVNRLWQHHFGRGIVATPSNFGMRGARPSHPQLLDWLAAELIRNQWRLKSIHKLILLSATYRQSFRSVADDRAVARFVERDPDNLLLWRREPRRLDAEGIRDNLLAVSGRLDLTMYGRGTLDANHPRRSVYLTVKRSRLIPVLQLFDAPDGLQGVGQRTTTTTPAQGLMMLNNPFVDHCATAFAARLDRSQPANDREWIRRGFLRAIGREPTTSEVKLGESLLTGGDGKRDFCQMLFCLNAFIYIE